MSKKGFIDPVIIMMTILSLTMDAVSLLLTLTGLCALSFINYIGAFFLISIMYVHTGSIMSKKSSSKMQAVLKKQFKKKIFKKIGLSALIEIIPLIGGIIPVWTISTYLHLKQSRKV